MIIAKNIYKSYRQGDKKIEILKDLNLEIKEGETVAIVGPSGSGKSTLLSIMSGIDTSDSGSLSIANKDISNLNQTGLSQLRASNIGIIFQGFELVPSFTAIENIMIPLNIKGQSGIKQAKDLLERVGLGERKYNLPAMLSGGEQQRVAIARALISDPKIILADEPTGNLDAKTGKDILNLILSEVKKSKKTMVIITHDKTVAEKMDRVLELNDGALKEITYE
jgi:putative ABC transport system ATP-binding protein